MDMKEQNDKPKKRNTPGISCSPKEIDEMERKERKVMIIDGH